MDDGKRKNSTVRRMSVSFLICWLLLTGNGSGAPLTASPSASVKCIPGTSFWQCGRRAGRAAKNGGQKSGSRSAVWLDSTIRPSALNRGVPLDISAIPFAIVNATFRVSRG